MFCISTYLFTGICEPIQIEYVSAGYNTDSIGQRYLEHTRSVLTCDSGYSRSGSSRRTCLASGDWDGEETTCEDNGNKLN